MKMIINKKGEGNFLKVIFFLLVLIVLIFFAGKGKQIFSEQSSDKTCSSDIEIVSLKNTAGDSSYESKLRCAPNYVTIKDKDKEKIEQALAREMLKCWTKFGEGEANLFSNKRDTMENYCMICSYVSFKNKGIIIDDFLDYLMTHKPYDSEHPQESYFERMYGTSQITDVGEMKQNEPKINTSNEYATLFTYAKQVEHWNKINAGVAGVSGGFAFGAGTGIALVSLLGISNPVGWVALGAFSGMSAFGIFSVSKAPWNVEKEWSGGIFLMPFTEESIIDKACTKLGS
jgi:hypothetical protein